MLGKCYFHLLSSLNPVGIHPGVMMYYRDQSEAEHSAKQDYNGNITLHTDTNINTQWPVPKYCR